MHRSLLQRLRIALLDDHAAIRHGLAARLAQETDIDIVGMFSSSQELIDALQRAPADLLLIDYALGHNDIDGHNLIRLLRIRFPKSKIVITSAHDNQATVTLAMQAGASGFVGKGQDLDELITAIRAVARGDTYLPPDIAAELSYKALQNERPATRAHTEAGGAADDATILKGNSELTPREREVLRCYLSGMSVAQIAEKFSRSNKTISTQKQAGYRKLGIRSDAEFFQIRYQLDNL
ncbi:MAG: two component LuxR family transcription regulator protein [Herbaspirillum sp.]|jgi:two-component system capsular synthesis response regulator RcsB|nr:two component LuxR family transcription regulator protein [Herbaspirillum sp.]